MPHVETEEKKEDKPELLLTDVLYKECGIEPHDRNFMVCCPFHTDRHPSAKVYVTTNSMYCWVCHKAWTAPYAIKELHGFQSYREVAEYVRQTYGIELYYTRSDKSEDLSLISLLNILKEYNFFDHPKHLKVLELAISQYNKKDRGLMNRLLEKVVVCI